jgi:hypothetical protein
VAAFSEPVEAHLARARLEAEGIGCLLADEHVVGVHWLCSVAVGGVKLQVREADLEAAREALRAASPRRSPSADWVTADLDAPRCPACGSLRIDRSGLSGRLARVSWSWLLQGPWPAPRARCESCAHRWRD